MKHVARARSAKRAGIGAAAIAAISIAGIGGASVATAFYPTSVAMQGVVKSQYVDAFIVCSEDAGVETVILTGRSATDVLAGWPGADDATYKVVESRMDSRDQGRLGRAITGCQAELEARFGEPIS
ncbi:hypothetical protein E4U02_07485 [Microbacterium paludicola]|uniref:Uncharacterized protein n=1 Tax=Microbacterium paludicola TaxID=300019 RepID=A0A4Y9FXT1_9MICO|nr:hypothetical protein [Microbacterium paludicola]MBF0816248.1 hypothetical protein [Microbacterium paludicola]TFU33051.1 hypothetical protein E4U02_07485 [Microbacterium paludicola]